MSKCPCGSKQNLESCCAPILAGKSAESAEQLMRARYTAFATGNVDFIIDSHHPSGRDELNREDISNWSKNSKWLGLEIKKAEDTRVDRAKVEFVCQYEDQDGVQNHHELSEFRQKENKWYFYDGKVVGEVHKRDEPKVGRNDPCPCGSGKKFKKCCGK
ncbi:YchJ family protein [bacterium]|nr:YchJ family protein [bacterium]